MKFETNNIVLKIEREKAYKNFSREWKITIDTGNHYSTVYHTCLIKAIFGMIIWRLKMMRKYKTK